MRSRKVVNRVMDEKLEDDQLSESPLTLARADSDTQRLPRVFGRSLPSTDRISEFSWLVMDDPSSSHHDAAANRTL